MDSQCFVQDIYLFNHFTPSEAVKPLIIKMRKEQQKKKRIQEDND